jgi:hypothetical protein
MKTLKKLAECNNTDTIKNLTYKLWPLIYKSRYKCSVQEAYYTTFDDGIGYGRPMPISEFKIFQPIHLLPYKCSFRNKGEYCANKVFLGGLLKDNKTILPISILSNKQKTIKFRGDNT